MRRPSITRLPLLLMAYVLSSSAFAFHPLLTDDVGTQGLAGNQLEIGYDQARSDGETSRGLGVTYTRGITDTLDVGVGIPYQPGDPDGFGNVGIGAKWRFYENEARKLGLALKPEVLLPVSRADEATGLGNGKLSYGLTFIATQETGFGELHFNAELARGDFADQTIDDRKTFWRLSVAPVWAVSEQWKLALDLGLQTNADRSQDALMGFVEAGVVYTPNAQFDFSAGLIRDLMDGPADTTALTTQVTWHF